MPRPDFVLMGNIQPDGQHAIHASVEIIHGDLIRERQIDFGDATVQTTYEMRADLRGIVSGYGDSYPEALADLLTKWTPTESPPDVTLEITARSPLIEEHDDDRC